MSILVKQSGAWKEVANVGSGGSASVPAFRASISTTQVVSSGAWIQVIFGNEEYNTETWFDNNVFTPQQAGWYHLCGYVQFGVNINPGSSTVAAQLRKNSSTEQQSYQTIANIANSYHCRVMSLVQANGTTDSFDILAYRNTLSTVNITSGLFYGFLVNAT